MNDPKKPRSEDRPATPKPSPDPSDLLDPANPLGLTNPLSPLHPIGLLNPASPLNLFD